MTRLFAVLLTLLIFVAETEACLATSPVQMPMLPKCLTCAKTLITLGGKRLDRDDVDMTSYDCALRTMTCTGVNPRLEINNGAITKNDADDGAADGMISIPLGCNEDGTAWLYYDGVMLYDVTKVVCFGM